MKRKFLPLFLLSCLAVIAAADSTSVSPVDPTELVAWLTAGISSKRLVRLVHERGLAIAPTAREMQQLAAAGADQYLVRALTNLKPVAVNAPRPRAPKALLRAAENVRIGRYRQAEVQLRAALRLDPQNAALHFALAAMLRQQEQWDDTYDELRTSVKLMPDFPENHSGLAYVFYRVDDGPNAIAEARTALSMDPKNAEAYRDLGLALQSTEQYTAAAHAFSESLSRDPDSPDTYYDLGIALQAEGKMSAAEAAYRHASHLRTASIVQREEHDLPPASTSIRASHVENPR